MKDFVSSHWISVVALVASMSLVCAIFVPYGVPTGLAWESVALRQTIDGVEGEPMHAVALPERVATPVGRAPLQLKRGRTL